MHEIIPSTLRRNTVYSLTMVKMLTNLSFARNTMSFNLLTVCLRQNLPLGHFGLINTEKLNFK